MKDLPCKPQAHMIRSITKAAQLLELERPIVMALNMSDVAKEMGVHIDIKKLSEMTGATIVETVGRNNVGTTELLQAVIDVAKEAKKTSATINYGPLRKRHAPYTRYLQGTQYPRIKAQ